MQTVADCPGPVPRSLGDRPWERWPHALLVPAVLAGCALLAFTSAREDSLTFDETATLTAGFSHLYSGDFRLEPEHPPLFKMLAALPLLGLDHRWPGPAAPGWTSGDYWQVGRTWLGAADVDRLVSAARSPMIAVLLATLLVVYGVTRRLFGREAALLALLLAALSPTLIGHGRLVKNDVPAALVYTLMLLTWARLLERVSWGRLAAAAAVAAALPLTKYSWPVVVPALIVMAVSAALGTPASPTGIERGRAARKLLTSGGLAVGLAAVAWLAVWTCYGWRYDAFRGEDRERAMFTPARVRGEPPPTTLAGAWDHVLRQPDGQPSRGPGTALVRAARQWRLLPEAYLYGLAYALRFTESRPGYLCGEIYEGGRRAYFPIALAVKSPPALLALVAAGALALVLRRLRARDPLLALGLVVFAGVFSWGVVTSAYNVGHRHLIPLFPALLVVAGASAAWLARRAGRALIGLGLAASLVSVGLVHPDYLGYFSELIGGRERGYHWLADSDADWGQHLKRLARWCDRHPGEAVKLSYFGSFEPRRYGVKCELLPGFLPLGPAPELTPGTYVVSVNQWLGLYDPLARDAAWQRPEVNERYRALWSTYGPQLGRAGGEAREQQQFRLMRWSRLVSRLRSRPPDERVAAALFVYRLDAEDLGRLSAP